MPFWKRRPPTQKEIDAARARIIERELRAAADQQWLEDRAAQTKHKPFREQATWLNTKPHSPGVRWAANKDGKTIAVPRQPYAKPKPPTSAFVGMALIFVFVLILVGVGYFLDHRKSGIVQTAATPQPLAPSPTNLQTSSPPQVVQRSAPPPVNAQPTPVTQQTAAPTQPTTNKTPNPPFETKPADALPDTTPRQSFSDLPKVADPIASPPPPSGDIARAPTTPHIVDLEKKTQTELIRVGCAPGKADGVWGTNSKAALGRYYEVTKQETSEREATPQVLTELRRAQDGLCLSLCGSGQRMTTKGCRSNAAPRQATVQRTAPATRSPNTNRRPASNCFSYNGETFC